MSFDNEKKNALNKLDKSTKGSIDEPIKHILDKINSLEDYYTTSSCSGRIMIMEPSEERHVDWLCVTHGKITAEDVEKHRTDTAWIKQTGLILHIACRNKESCENMLLALKKGGFKRAGIISLKKNIIEVMSTEQMAAPLEQTTEEYRRILVRKANEMMEKTEKSLERLEQCLKDFRQK